MAYKLKKGKEILEKTIRENLTHRDYKRVCAIASEYTKFASGVGINDLLRRFVPREDEEAFKQRVELSQLITPDIVNCLIAPMYKVPRANATYSIGWKEISKNEANKKTLTDALNKFYGDQSVDDYLAVRMADLDATDPNTFIVVEFAGEVDPAKPETKANPYPYEVCSEEAVNFKYVNNELQFLIVKTEFTEIEKDQPIALAKYTQYLDNESLKYTQIQNKNVDNYLKENPKAEIFYTDDKNKANGLAFVIEVYEHKAGRIPARRVGTKKDISTKNRTCVPMIHPAYSYIMKSVKSVSEFDLTNCLHVFQQKIQYDEVCPGNPKKKIICQNGLDPSGADCPECQGTGWLTHKSSSDIIRVRLPKNPSEMANLENYMAYKGPKMDLLEFQKKFGFYELKELSIKAVYASDTFVTNSIADTATEAKIDLESVYDTLKFYADSWSAMRKHITYVTAAYRSLGSGFECVHQFPKDFQMETLSMLLDYLAKANASGTPSYIKNKFNRKIAAKIYVDEPLELLEIEVKARFFPFNGKSESEINNIVLNDLCSKYNKILYANFEAIFAQLCEENNTDVVNFYMIEKTRQNELVKAKVSAMIIDIDKDNAAIRAADFAASSEMVDPVGGGAS